MYRSLNSSRLEKLANKGMERRRREGAPAHARSLYGQPFTRTYRLELSRSLGVARKRWRRSILEAARYRACASRTAGISWIPGKTGAHRAPPQFEAVSAARGRRGHFYMLGSRHRRF